MLSRFRNSNKWRRDIPFSAYQGLIQRMQPLKPKKILLTASKTSPIKDPGPPADMCIEASGHHAKQHYGLSSVSRWNYPYPSQFLNFLHHGGLPMGSSSVIAASAVWPRT
ncbi:hypothetical protein BC832DRAFT_557653 [Gaertneriomyces semiglobifer]|nr:hypothetical protein BC832DRAFT_557653 [Gaertneriomyces semiglobifer]